MAGNPHPLPLTPAQARKGAKESKLGMRAWVKLKKKELAAFKEAQILDLAKTALQSPVLAGSLAFAAVHVVESSIKATAATPKPQPGAPPVAQQSNDWVYNFVQALTSGAGIPGAGGIAQGLGAAIGSLAGSSAAGKGPIGGSGLDLSALFAGLDFAALKLAILLYIASGGNLAGLLQSSSGLLGNLISKLGVVGE